ncbi:MAG: MoaD/ThiS family protein [Eubacteriales bacterium]|nr:MoaD/ThiS family protein [Eubacteriales bacterium]
MKVKYFAYLRNDSACKEESIPGSFTALSLLHFLAERHGSGLRKHILSEDGEKIHDDLIFLVDGRHIEFMNGEETQISSDAVVSLFPRIAGG